MAQTQLVDIDPQGGGQTDHPQHAQQGIAGVVETHQDQGQVPQPPDDPHQNVGFGLSQGHQLGQQVAAPAQLLPKAEEPVDDGRKDQRGEQHQGQELGCRRHLRQVGAHGFHLGPEMDQPPVGLSQAQGPAQAVDCSEGCRDDQRGSQVRPPGAEAQVGHPPALSGNPLHGDGRRQRRYPHHPGHGKLAVHGRLFPNAEATGDQQPLQQVGQGKGDGQIRENSFAIDHGVCSCILRRGAATGLPTSASRGRPIFSTSMISLLTAPEERWKAGIHADAR